MKKEKSIIIWPIYFNLKVSRRKGRKVPRGIAVEDPKLEEISEALKKLKLKFIVEEEKAYPRMWWREKGRIIVEKMNSKSKMLKEIAKIIKNIRLAREHQRGRVKAKRR
ncbi:MAG: signal recognition particle subunit SRP19/SEC65 family protein [archaeon GB-1867-097]|nr:signal recognition particle subunit SRP19/SEC65 family protein [Candidatus Culexmicrobium thermophilum]MCS7384665.1 signal recognition particle subunit SRP19/SEC65 family protein [Candidatus Culexmicrobium thermophilum]